MTLPHAQLLSRRFVLIPALELDGSLQAPDGTRLADALAALDVTEGVRWAGPPLACPAPRP
jgi:7,8-dihydro-6-hydroxymethylpterin-pyrophosphokinase